MEYIELQVTSNFSFLRGASHPEELIDQAAQMGYQKLAITDRNTLAGIVRAHVAARNHDIQLIPACRLQGAWQDIRRTCSPDASAPRSAGRAHE
ncbi:MAG: PHP domain-containing protein [Sphingobacteriales bacterium]|nr:MAG: PHP domain-containing protein [Sphingobacteriales bacterium]